MLSLANYPYSRQEIIDALHGKRGNRQIRFRYDLLDKNDNKIKELDSVVEGEVSMASLSSINRTAKFKIKDKGDINWLTDRIQPFVELKMPEKVGDANVLPTFSRSSVAYKQDGTQVASGQPRYEQGKFGRGIMIEEGTTNLLSGKLKATDSIREGKSGWERVGVSNDNPRTMLNSTTIPVKANTTYTFSCLYWSSNGVLDDVYIKFNDAGWNESTYYIQPFVQGTNKGIKDLGNGWKYCCGTFTTKSTTSTIEQIFFDVDVNGVTVFICSLQLEEKNYATSFVDGTRAAETLTIPAAGVLNKDEGTIECWFYYKPNGAYQRIVSFVGSALNGYRDLQFDITNTGYVRFQPKRLADGTGIISVQSANPISEGWHFVACTWNRNEIKIAVDNQPIVKNVYGGGIATLDSSFTIGKEHNVASAFLNNLIDDLRISSRARTDQEILAAYQSNSPLPVDKDTTYKLNFDGNLTAKAYQPSQWIEFPLGIFLLSSPTRKDSNNNVYRDVEAYDGLLILRDDKFDTRYTVKAGTNYRQAVIDILASAGITKHNIEQTDKVLPVDMEFAPGTEKLEAINTLLQAINYTPIHVDVYGYFTSMTYRSPSIRSAEYTYKDDELSIIYDGMEEELDLFGVPNKWVVVSSQADRNPLTSMYTNNNPDSPTSTVSRGRTIVDYQEVTDIADQQSLDAYVQRIAFEASQVYGKLTFETAINPLHDYMDVLQIQYSALGINDKYSETGWTMPLKAGARMKHEVRKVVSI